MTPDQTACQKCGSSLASRLYCFSCKNVQPLSEGVNYYEALGLKFGFEVNEVELEEKYQKLSFELHPDFFYSASESEKYLSERASAFLNTAYKNLCNPTLRAEYLFDFFSQNKKLDERLLPDGFLVEVFSLQESLDELLESEEKSELLSIRENLEKRQKEFDENFFPLFKKLENSPNDLETLQQLQTCLNAKRYLNRLLERIE